MFTLGIWCFTGFSSLFPLVVAALYWRRLTAAGAAASILVTAALWILFFYQSEFGAKPVTPFGMLPVATMFVASTTVMLVVSLLTKPPSDATLHRFFGKPS